MDTYAAASTIYHFFNTHKADGTPITLAGTPGIDIYKDNGTTQDADDSGLTLTVDFDGVTGLHLVAIDTSSDGTFYATGHVFNVVLSAGTVDSVSVVGTTVYQFKLGEVPADVAKISGDSTAADNLEDFYEETTAIGNLIDMFDGTGYAGGTIKLATDATLNATQGSYAPAKAGDAMDLIADAIKKTTFDESTAFPVLSADTGATALARTGADSDTLKTLSDQIDGAALEATLTAIKGAGWSTETLAAIDALIDAVKAKTDLIPASPAAVGSAMTLTSAYDAAKTAAQASDIPTANITAILADTNELQAEMADGGRTDLILDGIEAHAHATDGHITADYGATEKAAIDLLDDVDGGLGDVHTVANAIKAKTDNLPADPADESSLEAAITAAHSTTNGKIDAVDDYVDTEIAAIITTLSTIQGYVDDLESRLTAARAGYLDLLNTNLDAAISTRAPSSTALSSATWTNTKAGYIDAAISSVGGGAAPTVEQIRAEMDNNSTKLALLSNGTYGLSAIKTIADTISGYVDDLETRLTATRAGYLDNIATAPPTASDIDTELSGTHGAGAWGASGTGSSTYTDTITDDNSDPLEDVQVELYSDSDYTTLVAVEDTDVNGAFTFSLNPGVYYVRCVKSGYSFTDFSKTVT